MTSRHIVACGLATAAMMLLPGCSNETPAPAFGTGADLTRGAIALQQYGCGVCHRIPGIAGADGIVGPPLVDMGRRVYIARGLPNTPANMIHWIRKPQELAPRSAMPDLQVTAADARAMTAYLYRSS